MRRCRSQYVTFMSEAARLDFGESLWLRRPVIDSVGERIAATARLAFAAVVIAIAISFPLGILAALRQRGPIDYSVSVISLVGQSVPGFWLGIMLILIFARQLRWLPSAGSQTPQHLILPAITLALPLVGVLTRLVRSGLLEVMHEDYIRTARAKGSRLPHRAHPARHAQHAHSGRHGARNPARQPARRRGHRGNRLRLARHRSLAGRRDHPARLPAGAGLHSLHHRRFSC